MTCASFAATFATISTIVSLHGIGLPADARTSRPNLAGGAEQAQPADAAAELRQLTQQRFDANAANDRAFYERLIAENALILLPGQPPQTKEEYLDGEFLARPAGYRGQKSAVADFRARVNGDSAAVSYTASEPTSLGAQSFESRTVRLDTYVRLNGAWRLLGMAVTELPSWPDVATIDPRLYSEYAGTYQLSPAVQIVITYEAGHLMAAMSGQAKTELFPENATTFFDKTDSPLARTVFERDGSGKVVAQIYRAQGQQVRAIKIR